MLEFILSVVPLILLCTAIGLLVINFDEVLSYLIYLAKSLVQPDQAYTQFAEPQLPNPEQQAVKQTLPFYKIPLLILRRCITLIRVIFLPDIHISTGLKSSTDEEVNVFDATAQQEAQKSELKTYNTPNVSTEGANAGNPAKLIVNRVSAEHHSVPIFSILKHVIVYLLIIFPFALIGAGIMMYFSETKITGESLDRWLTAKVATLVEMFSNQ